MDRTTMITPAQRREWERTGTVVLRGALDDPLVNQLTAAVEEIERWAHDDGPGMHHFEHAADGPRVARSEFFDEAQPVMSAFMRQGLLPDVLAELLGEPAVLFKEKINYKYPGGGGFAPHQDATAYRFVDHHLSVMVPIDEMTQDNGCLWFATAPKGEVLPHHDGRIDEAWVATAAWRPVTAAPGDLVVFDSYAPHRSDTNETGRPRRAVYLTYNAASDGDHRDEYYRDKRAVFDADGATGASGNVRISVNDDFLGRMVDDNDGATA